MCQGGDRSSGCGEETEGRTDRERGREWGGCMENRRDDQKDCGHNDEASGWTDGFHPVCSHQRQRRPDRRSVASGRWSLVLMPLDLHCHVTSPNLSAELPQGLMADSHSSLLVTYQVVFTSPQLSAVYVTKCFYKMCLLTSSGPEPRKTENCFSHDSRNWILICCNDTSRYRLPDLQIHVRRNGLWKSPS